MNSNFSDGEFRSKVNLSESEIKDFFWKYNKISGKFDFSTILYIYLRINKKFYKKKKEIL